MDKKTISIAILATAVVLLGAFLLKVPSVVTVTDTIRETLGAQSGPTFLCETATWNPANISSTANSTTTLTVQGASVGDPVVATFATTTRVGDWAVLGNVKSANTIYVSLELSASSTDLNLATGTVRACFTKSY